METREILSTVYTPRKEDIAPTRRVEFDDEEDMLGTGK